MGVLQHGNGHQNADEEDDRTHVDACQRMHQRQVALLAVFLLQMQEIPHHPQHAQAKQDAHERRQMGHGLEDRHTNQNAQAQ